MQAPLPLADDGSWSDHVRRGARPHRLRAARRLVSIVLWTLACMPVQTALVLLPGRLNLRFARIYWAGMCRLIGLSIRTLGTPATARPVITVATHSSWLDVLVLGARLPAHFVAKSEVGTWPVVSFIAWLGATVYVRRTRASTAREAEAMRDRLRAGDSLILFPEGTTSDGARVAPFRSAFLSIAETRLPDGTAPLVQPVSLVYDRLAGLPVRHPNRPLFAWVGDESLAPHFWRLAQQSAFRATVLFHPPVDPAATPSRKALTEAVWRTCAEGSDQLRQNRI